MVVVRLSTSRQRRGGETLLWEDDSDAFDFGLDYASGGQQGHSLALHMGRFALRQ